MQVRQVLHRRQVVGDEQVRGPGLALQVEQQVHERALHRDVQRRHGLVADHQVGPGGEGPGDGHPLLLAAAQLARVAVEVGRREPHGLQQLERALARPPAGRARPAA